MAVAQWTEALQRDVLLREGTSDRTTWADTFGPAYHLPPADVSPDVVLDLGANIGLTAAHYQSLWPLAMIWAVEPDPGNFDLLRANAPRAVPIKAAVGQCERGGEYQWLDKSGMPEAYHLRAQGELSEKGEWVYVLGVDLLRNVIGSIDFCKVDVEGAEWKLLDQLAGIPHLHVEFHDTAKPAEGLPGEIGARLLEERGYEVTRPWRDHPNGVYARMSPEED